MPSQGTSENTTRDSVSQFSRRSLITTATGAGTAVLAGCSSNGGNESGGKTTTTTQATNKKPVKIGLLMPFSGPFASFGKAIEKGVRLALEKQLGGEIDGRSVQLVKRDSKFSPSTAVTKARELINQDNVNFIIGPGSSSSALAIKPVIDQAGSVTWFNVIASTMKLISQNCTPYQFRVGINTYAIGNPMGPWTKKNIGDTAAVVVLDNSYGHNVADWFRQSYENAGGTVRKVIAISPGASNYAPFIRTIADTGADAAFASLPGHFAASFLKAAQKFGLSEQMGITGFGLVGRLVQKAAPKAMKGIPAETSYTVELDNAANQRYLNQYDEMFGGLPPTQSLSGYEAMHLVGIAVRETGGVKPTDVVPFLRGYNFDKSPRGMVKIDPVTQDAIIPMFMVKATGTTQESFTITHKFNSVNSPNFDCNLKGALSE